ncbi:hypothetical protein F5Y17DRAFT_34783 [Xylariaceae sp. FL0594]|nr:hypothetical protein F5Y17DRAFT_34783 [Xylariaceae sp. FL0594]
MATEVLESVISNVPDWLRRLGDLNGEIEQRQRDLAIEQQQQDLAKLSEEQPGSLPIPSARSIRRRGSTETLRPKDGIASVTDGAKLSTPDLAATTEPTSTEPTPDPTPNPIISTDRLEMPNGTSQPDGSRPPSPPAGNSKAMSVVRQPNELPYSAQRRARATVRKRQKTESMMTSEEATRPKYRTRVMVVVYYDSYVQSVFEELVKFVSSQRNLIRKAKMAEKVAQIRRLAELEMPEGDDDDDNNNNNSELKTNGGLMATRPLAPGSITALGGPEGGRPQYYGARPSGSRSSAAALQLMPTRSMRTSALNGGLGLFNGKADIWDELDKGLEFVQSMCEHAAHQFLRDGDCSVEVEKIKTRLAKVKESATDEKQRMASKQEGETQNQPVPKEDKIQFVPKSQKIQPIPLCDKIQHIPLSEKIASLPILEAAQPARFEVDEEPKRDETQLLPIPGIIQGENNGGVPCQNEPTRLRTYRPATVRMGTGASTSSKFPVGADIEIDEGIDVDMDDFKPVYRSTRLMRRPI